MRNVIARHGSSSLAGLVFRLGNVEGINGPLFSGDDFLYDVWYTNPFTGQRDPQPRNPQHYASQSGAQKLAAMVGGQAFSQVESPDINYPTWNVRFPSGVDHNAGETMSLLNAYGLQNGLAQIAKEDSYLVSIPNAAQVTGPNATSWQNTIPTTWAPAPAPAPAPSSVQPTPAPAPAAYTPPPPPGQFVYTPGNTPVSIVTSPAPATQTTTPTPAQSQTPAANGGGNVVGTPGGINDGVLYPEVLPPEGSGFSLTQWQREIWSDLKAFTSKIPWWAWAGGAVTAAGLYVYGHKGARRRR